VAAVRTRTAAKLPPPDGNAPTRPPGAFSVRHSAVFRTP